MSLLIYNQIQKQKHLILVPSYLDITLFSNYGKVRGKPLNNFGLVYPSFVTYNIKRTYQLRWVFNIELAGESVRLVAHVPVSILAAS